MKSKNFISSTRAAITIEFVFMLSLLLLLFIFMADLAIVRSNIGRLDRTSYSLLNLVKERTALHNGEAKLKDNELSQLEELSKYVIYGDNSDREISLYVEYYNLNTENPEPQVVKSSDNCVPNKPIQELADLSAHSETNNRRIPIYQVTVCMPAYSMFKAITVGEEQRYLGMLRSSAVGILR